MSIESDSQQTIDSLIEINVSLREKIKHLEQEKNELALKLDKAWDEERNKILKALENDIRCLMHMAYPYRVKETIELLARLHGKTFEEVHRDLLNVVPLGVTVE